MERKFFGPILSSFLALTACNTNPDIADGISLACRANPNVRVSKDLKLGVGESFHLAGREVTAESAGQLLVSGERPFMIGGKKVYITGVSRYNGRTYIVSPQRVENKNTYITITHHCSKLNRLKG